MPQRILPIAVVIAFGLLPSATAGPSATRAIPAPAASGPAPEVLQSDYVLLAWNDLGMHCMNRLHHVLSVLPPFNNLYAQLVRRGDAVTLPRLVAAPASVSYSFPGNTTSITKTDFWTYAPALFGVTLPPDVGLTGKGLGGAMDPGATFFSAVGIPLTPFPDATPSTESPYQQALVIARDSTGAVVAQSQPVVPVSVEMGCVSSGCHASETAIVNAHENVSGYDPQVQPILCAGCHADPALGTTGRSDAGYFSLRMHEAHSFLDQQFTGTALCYHCHPGPNARCLRGTMSTRFGLVCQDCHGGMANMAATIQAGRVPWVQEPSCATCHAPQFAEPDRQLFKLSTGHGGVYCEGCHNSTHAEWSSREVPDNAAIVALQGVAGPLADCRVCHGVNPAGAGPHGIMVTGVPEAALLEGARPMTIVPNPTRGGCALSFRARDPAAGKLLVHDAQGRLVRLLRARAGHDGRAQASWDGRDSDGVQVRPGTYFVRWKSETERIAGRVTIVR